MASIRRIEGKGGVSFKITVSLGRDAKDKQIRHYKTWKPDKPMSEKQMEKAVQKVAYEFERDLTMGFQVDNRQTFEEYAAYVYELRIQRGDKPQTLARVRRQTDRINKHIGRIKLTDIRPQHLNTLYRELLKPGANTWMQFAKPIVDLNQFLGERGYKGLSEKCNVYPNVIARACRGEVISKKNAEKIGKHLGRKDLFEITGTDRPLSPATIKGYHSIIFTVLAQAEKEMIVMYNAAERATLPASAKVRPSTTLQIETVSAVLEALEGEPFDFRMMIHLFLVTGCRRGEIMAISWDKINFDTGEVKIDSSMNYLKGQGLFIGPTKTGNTRYITLPAETLAMLRRYRLWQLERRLQAGPEWVDTGLLFTRPDGRERSPAAVNKDLDTFTKKHDLPHIHPHKFRHTFASLLIANGTDVQTVSSLLGHANTNTTLGTYAHAVEEAKRKAADCVSTVILQKKKA